MAFTAFLGANSDAVLLTITAIALGAFLIYERRRGGPVEIQKLIWPLIYMVLYKTTWGLDAMGKWAKRHGRALRIIVPVIIATGYLGMIYISYFLVASFFDLFTAEQVAPAAALVLPIQTGFTFYVPFFYWIISIFLIASVHEMSHGIIARLYDIKVKSSGFAFLSVLLPIIPAAFVEPDEKDIVKRPWHQQVGVYAAGPFSNIVFGFVALGILIALFAPLATSIVSTTTGEGVIITDVLNESALAGSGYAEGAETITAINGAEVDTIFDLSQVMQNTSAGQEIMITTDRDTYDVTLKEHPANESFGYLGVLVETKNPDAFGSASPMSQGMVLGTAAFPNLYTAPGELAGWIEGAVIWLIGLFVFLVILNLGIGLFNLLPIFIADGARILWVTIRDVFKLGDEHAARITMIVSTVFLIVLLGVLILPFTPILDIVRASMGA